MFGVAADYADAVQVKVARKVLIVDDDAELLRSVREAVSSFLGWDVVATVDSVYGFELALQDRFDLFVFDFAMPKLEGDLLYELLGIVYARWSGGVRRIPPLLLLSGHGEDERAQELLKLPGVRGILPKPFTIQRLLDKFEQCVE